MARKRFSFRAPQKGGEKMAKYPFETIEPKWQAYWDKNKPFKVKEDLSFPK